MIERESCIDVEVLAPGEADRDSGLYETYGDLVNSSYPAFLSKLGLDHIGSKAEGAVITDSTGRTYIDCVGGYGVFNLGHNHRGVVEALVDQLRLGEPLTRPLITEVQVALAEKLKEISPGELACSFILNSGSEAIDCALKLVRLHKGGKQIVTASGSFHGHTFGALSASGIGSFKRSFEPLVPGIVQVPFGDAEALAESMSTTETAAVLIEPIQHEAGVTAPPSSYLRDVRRICDQHDAILIFDEIKMGFGRTGRMFACEHSGVVPDVMVVGKSLGGGLMPISAVIAHRRLWRRFGMSFSLSASSFGGNALACRAGLATIHHILAGRLLRSCADKGFFLLAGLKSLVSRYRDILCSAAGIGLLIGVEAASGRMALRLSREMIARGVLTVRAYGNPAVLMIEPPLVISIEQLQSVLNAFETACEAIRPAE